MFSMARIWSIKYDDIDRSSESPRTIMETLAACRAKNVAA